MDGGARREEGRDSEEVRSGNGIPQLVSCLDTPMQGRLMRRDLFLGSGVVFLVANGTVLRRELERHERVILEQGYDNECVSAVSSTSIARAQPHRSCVAFNTCSARTRTRCIDCIPLL